MQTLRIPIISGGAFGIDQLAHQIALRHQVPTLVVLPSGLSSIYPEKLTGWIEPILSCGGAFLSEYLPSTKIQKHYFQQRNRLIAGLSLATLIIEAKRKSGTLITARQAIEQGKPLFVLPSHPLDYNNLGALDLLMEGATPVVEAQDLIILMSSELKFLSNSAKHLVPM